MTDPKRHAAASRAMLMTLHHEFTVISELLVTLGAVGDREDVNPEFYTFLGDAVKQRCTLMAVAISGVPS